MGAADPAELSPELESWRTLHSVDGVYVDRDPHLDAPTDTITEPDLPVVAHPDRVRGVPDLGTPPPDLPPTRREDRFAGALLGVAAGDALGATLEFVPPDRITELHRDIVGGGVFRWRPGQGTDDTDLTWAVLRAHLDHPPEADHTTIVDAAARNMLAWADAGPRDIGGTTAAALDSLRRHGSTTRSGRTHERSAGSGSLMRCLPTALACPRDHHRRRRLAAAISAITHAEPRCIDACVAYTDLIAGILAGLHPSHALADVAAGPDRHPAVAEALSVDGSLPVEELSTTGFVIDSLRCAAWALGQPRSLEDTLVRLVSRGDDADTTGAIVGGLLGVAHGVHALPGRWLAVLEYRERLEQAAGELVERDRRA